MRIVYSWLREFLPDAPSPQRLEEMLAGLGIETETIDELPAPSSKIVFANVLSAEPIPGTELRKLILDIGKEVQVISGALNARAGVGVALAQPGTVLPNGVELGIRKIQGHESFGMALSPKEIEVGEFASGLFEFPLNALPPGTPLAEAWADDQVIEIEITPNRPDWLSVYGTARDLAALGLTLIHPDPKPKTSKIDLPFQVWIEDTKGCDRFTLSYARNIKVGPSPLLAQRRLYAAGMRPISNVVDATNYAMLELGNPMHAYDASYVGEGLYVRRAKAGEKVTTLDGQERSVDERDLLIAVKHGNTTRPAGLAGVMGGADDEIRDTTTQVALEVAHFDPVSVRLTARRQGLKTEASYRFERGVDTDGQLRAAKRFMQLVQEWHSDVEVAHDCVDLNHIHPAKPVKFRTGYANRLVGTNYTEVEQTSVLKKLGFEVEAGTEAGSYQVTAPSYRSDIGIEEDLVEEVARVLGYENIPLTLPSFFPHPDNVGVDEPYLVKERLRTVMAGLGFQEVVNYSWSSMEECERHRAPGPTVFMANPQASDRTALRTALYPSLLHNLRTALQHSDPGPYLLFEIGHVFGATEESRVAALLSGETIPGLWQQGLSGGYYAFKGLLETAAHNLGGTIKIEKEAYPHLHPGISGAVYWNGQKIGSMGALHPAIAAELEVPQTFVVELILPLPKPVGSFKDVAKYPASLRDIAVVVPEAVTYGEVEALIRTHAGEHLEHLDIFDVYRGEPLNPGEKSMAFHLNFRHQGHTLTDSETDGFMQSVIGAVEKAGYAIRK